MRKTIIAILGALVVVGIALAIIPTTRDEIHWRWATHKNETASYEAYLKAWPEGRHAAEAWTRYDEHGWGDAEAANSVKAFERYVQLHGEGKHVVEAKDKIESLHWQEATTANTIRAYRGFAAAHPKGRLVQQAETRASALRTDQTPYDAALQAGTVASLKQFLVDFPGHEKEAKAQQVLKDITEGRDIIDLLNEKKIEIVTQGSGIKSVQVRLRRLVPYPITVRVPVGSYFVSARKSAQNMVTTAESKVRLATDEWISVLVSAACANRPRDIPGSKDSFTVQRSPHQAELARLIPILDRARVRYAVHQAAVWIVTDNADYDDLGILVSRPAFQLFGGTRQIKEPEAAQAMKICANAGIDIQKKAIWKDHETIYWRLKADDASKKWLEAQNPSLARRAKEVLDEMEAKLVSLDKKVVETLKAKRLSVYLGVASGAKGPHGAWLASFLQGQGHDVELAAVTSGSAGVTVHFREGFEAEAKALSQLVELLFGAAADSRKIGKGGISSKKDLVIWLR